MEERNAESKKYKKEKENRKTVFGFYFGTGVQNFKVPCRSSDYVLYGGAKYFGSSVGNFLHVSFLEPTVLTSLLYLQKICASLQ
jgi:hypothetical protein